MYPVDMFDNITTKTTPEQTVNFFPRDHGCARASAVSTVSEGSEIIAACSLHPPGRNVQWLEP
jgi:hypothetical protein